MASRKNHVPVHVRGKIWDSFIKSRLKLCICLKFTVHLRTFCEFLQIISFILLFLLLGNKWRWKVCSQRRNKTDDWLFSKCGKQQIERELNKTWGKKRMGRDSGPKHADSQGKIKSESRKERKRGAYWGFSIKTLSCS